MSKQRRGFSEVRQVKRAFHFAPYLWQRAKMALGKTQPRGRRETLDDRSCMEALKSGQDERKIIQ